MTAIRIWIALGLRGLADWLDPLPMCHVVVPKDALFHEACLLSLAQEAQREVTGEWRRHQVYAALLKRHPEATKREVAMAIEAAVRTR